MDARIRYTKGMIKQEFIKLLDKNNISKITVSKICENAQINRATFYKYYDNPYDLLKKIEGELLDSLQEKIEKHTGRNFVDILRIVLNDLKENADVYTVIFSGNGDLPFRERVFSLCYQENIEYISKSFPGLGDTQKEWLYDFMLEGSNGIINAWINGGMIESIDDIVAFNDSLARSIHYHLLEHLQPKSKNDRDH